MRLSFYLAVASLAFSAEAHAERLSFDHRLYPPLKAVLDSGRAEMTEFDNSNPRYLFDRIAVQGKSATDWSEAIEIVTRASTKDMRSAQDWVKELEQKYARNCPGKFELVARDENSLTYLRRSNSCPAGQTKSALFRFVTGKRSLFLLNPIYKGEMSEDMKKQWLALLESARLQ